MDVTRKSKENSLSVDVREGAPESYESVELVEDSILADQPVMSKRCLVHVFTKEIGKLLPMTTERWNVILKAANNRKKIKNFEKSKYRHIVNNLPKTFSISDGYHSKCYGAFTAVNYNVSCADPEPELTTNLRRDDKRENQSRVGIFEDKCIFCDRKYKTVNKKGREALGLILTKDAEHKIREVCTILNDRQLAAKISGIDLIAKEAKFHHSCRKTKLAAAERLKKSTTPKKDKTVDKSALLDISEYVKKHIITGLRPELLKSLYDRYKAYCDCAEQEYGISSAQYLAEFLKKKFPDGLAISTPDGKKLGSIVHHPTLDHKSVKAVYDFKTSDECQIIKSALLLRQELKSVKKNLLTEPLDAASLMRGEADAPQLVQIFFKTLFGGPNRKSESLKRRAASACDDALYNVHNGEVMPKKHILLASLVKTLTGSCKLITVLNRLGHCISYTKYEELETGLATSIQSRQKCSPNGAKFGPIMGTAFDNYDENMHTLSGLNSLHDTMGIFYQNIDVTAKQLDNDEPSVSPTPTLKEKRKRKLDIVENQLEPYRKKARIDTFRYFNSNCNNLPDSSTEARMLDCLFLVAQAIGSEKVPLWGGFNRLFHKDKLPKQNIFYLPNLNKPITSDTVVAETMRIAIACARECGQNYGLVTYDLDVAKVAHRIQATSQPEFDSIFVMFGAFHLFMCLFRAIGRLIADSGCTEMLTDSGVLAGGSVRGFLECYNYNRCKRIHPMLSVAFEILLFRRFMEEYSNADLVKTELTDLNFKTKERVDEVCESAVFKDLFAEFEVFKSKVEKGALGKTAQFWAMYVKYVHLYHILERSVRENDIDLFIYTLTPVTDLFFATNRVNYSRWMAKYQLDLMNIDRTHPGLRQLLDKGGFSIRRTENQFSRIAVDLTLEQTVNCDAASRLTGYTSSTNNYSSRVRWSITKSSRAAMVNEALSMAGLKNSGGVDSHLSKSRIERDNGDLKKIIEQIESCVQPFRMDVTSPLVNISTGKSVPDSIANVLLNVPADGKKRHTVFVEECAKDASRFEHAIKKHPLKTFTDNCVTNRRAGKNTKEAQLKCTSELFGRIAFTASKTEIDLEHVFSYPLTPVPLSMCKGDGSMAHTDKSKLGKLLEDTVQNHGIPSNVGTHIIDVNFLLHVLQNQNPVTYGDVAKNILVNVVSYRSKRFDVVFDTYERPSIKDCERDRRSADLEKQLVISGDQQRVGASLKTLLAQESFKRELPVFLQKNWSSEYYSEILKEKELFLGVMEDCSRYSVDNEIVRTEHVDALHCNHQEGDTRIILHMITADRENPGDIVVRASDTDILILILHHLHRIKSTVWMDVGTASQNNRRYINVSKVASTIGSSMCAALVGLHAFTGCDYSSAFVRKGKNRPYEIVKKDIRFQNAFAEMSKKEVLNNETVVALQDFVCSLYGARKVVGLNKHRFNVIERTYTNKPNATNPFDKLKSISGSSIPPCQTELAPHISRCAYVARLWGHAHEQYLDKVVPKSGWVLEDGEYRIIWFEGDQMPRSLSREIEVDKPTTTEDGDETEIEEDEDHVPLVTEMESSSDEDSDEETD